MTLLNTIHSTRSSASRCRGPNPLSGSPHAATGSTPGLGVIQVTEGGKGGVLKSVVRISNIDTAGVERADVHGIRVRLR